MNVLPGLRFDCTCCGRCCQQWGVEVNVAEKERLEKLDWNKVTKAPARDQFFRQVGSRWLLGLQPSGLCRFLGDDKLCIIHKRFGLEAKPATCQRFPYHFARTPTGVYASLSYVSVGACANVGRELSEYVDELAALHERLGGDREHGAEVALTDTKRIGWNDYLALEERIRAGFEGALWPALLAGERLLTDTIPSAEYLPISGLNWRQRAILGLCVQAFLQTTGAATFVGPIVMSVLQRRLEINGRSVAFADLAVLPKISLDAGAETMLRRFLVQSLFGKCYFGRWGDDEVSVLAGYRLLMLQYVLVILSARLGVGVSEALMTTSRNLQHRAALGSWVLPAEQLATEMRALVPRIVSPE
jgi:Fe-S-cluster containining protein